MTHSQLTGTTGLWITPIWSFNSGVSGERVEAGRRHKAGVVVGIWGQFYDSLLKCSKSLQSHFLCFAPLSSQTSQDWRICKGCKVSFSLCNPILVRLFQCLLSFWRIRLSAFFARRIVFVEAAPRQMQQQRQLFFQQAAVSDFPPTLLAGRSKAASSVKLLLCHSRIHISNTAAVPRNLNYRFLKLLTWSMNVDAMFISTYQAYCIECR